MDFRKYLTWLIFLIILIYGPIDHGDYWWVVRSCTLILIPLAVWFSVGWAWKHLALTNKTDDLLVRFLGAFVSIAFLIIAFNYATAETHTINTQDVISNYGIGYEQVGDYIVVDGADWNGAIVYTVIAIIILKSVVFNKAERSEKYN